MPSTSLGAGSDAQTRKRKRKNEQQPDDQAARPEQNRYTLRRARHSSQRELSVLNSRKQIEGLQLRPNHRPRLKPTRPQKKKTTLSSCILHVDIWYSIAECLAQPLGIKWPYEDPSLDSDGEWHVARKTLLSLCRTSRLHRETANKSLYRSICLESGKSAYFFMRTLFESPGLRGYVRELILTRPVEEYECRKVFIDGIQCKDPFSLKCIVPVCHPEFITQWESQCEDSRASEEVAHSSPTMATLTIANIFHKIPRLRSLLIRDAFIPHSTAGKIIERSLHEMRDKPTRYGPKSKGYILSELSTLVILGKSSTESTRLTADWARIFRPYSKVGIKNMHLVRVNSFIEMPSSIETLCLSDTPGDGLGLEKMENLTSLNIFSDGAKIGNLPGAYCALRHFPPTLKHLRFDSGYSSYFHSSITCLESLSALTQLTSLQLPMALLFGEPDKIPEKHLTDIFPPSLIRLVLQEIWSFASLCDESGDYGKKMASCLNRVVQELPSLESLEFCEQWPYWRHALANQNKPLPPLDITDLFPDSSSFLCKRAAAYMQSNMDDALELASRAVALEPQNREALLCLSQIQAGLGQPEAAMKTLAGLNPPARLCVSDPIKDMFDHVNIARKCLREDPKSALEALNKAMGGLVNRYHAPREWVLMKSEAYLSICPNKASAIARDLLRANKGDVEALLLAGRASCNSKDYKSATRYFQWAKCYDYKRSDVTEWLNTSIILREAT